MFDISFGPFGGGADALIVDGERGVTRTSLQIDSNAAAHCDTWPYSARQRWA